MSTLPIAPGIKFFLGASLLVCVVILPINVTGNEVDSLLAEPNNNYTFTNFDKVGPRAKGKGLSTCTCSRAVLGHCAWELGIEPLSAWAPMQAIARCGPPPTTCHLALTTQHPPPTRICRLRSQTSPSRLRASSRTPS